MHVSLIQAAKSVARKMTTVSGDAAAAALQQREAAEAELSVMISNMG